MEELIKVIEKNGRSLVDARELHQFLEVSTRFNDWISNRINKYMFEQDVDYTTFTNNLVNGGRSIEYAITLGMAKELSMVENNQKGSIARKYFIEIENRYKSNNLPATYLDALKALVVSEEQKQLAQQQVRELEPKAKIYDNICDSSSILSLNEAGKIIGIGRNTFTAKLRELKILQLNNNPYQEYIDRGYFVVKLSYISSLKANLTTTYVTGKGVVWLKQKLL